MTKSEDTLPPHTVAELNRLGLTPREIALDGAFNPGPTTTALAELDREPGRVFIAGRQQPGSRRTQRRLQRYRTGAEGRISHTKRRYGLRRSRLKGRDGQQIWTGWGILAYNLDTLAIRLTPSPRSGTPPARTPRQHRDGRANDLRRGRSHSRPFIRRKSLEARERYRVPRANWAPRRR